MTWILFILLYIFSWYVYSVQYNQVKDFEFVKRHKKSIRAFGWVPILNTFIVLFIIIKDIYDVWRSNHRNKTK